MNKQQGMGKRNEPQPTFDFSKVGRGFSREWSELVNRATAVGKILVGLMPEGNSREQLEEFEALHNEYHQKMAALGDEQAVLICKILKTVPKTWLLKDAPADLDFSQIDSLDWIQVDRYSQLLEMVGKGEHYKLSAKN